jgi:hypothetical protein
MFSTFLIEVVQQNIPTSRLINKGLGKRINKSEQSFAPLLIDSFINIYSLLYFNFRSSGLTDSTITLTKKRLTRGQLITLVGSIIMSLPYKKKKKIKKK